jgi:transposase, IS30 family
MPAHPLTAPEREEIRVGITAGETDAEIAGRLGRHRITIHREIARNGGRAGYSATAAQGRADRQRCRPKDPKLVADAAVADHVRVRLEAKDSPMTISLELAAGTHGMVAQLSHETIYQAVYGHGRRGLPKGLHTRLHRRRRCRKRRHPRGCEPTKASPLGEFTLIHQRPPEAATRSEVGHIEGDLICGSYNRSAIVTLFDRASRYVWLADLPEGHTAPATLAALIETFERIPPALRRTLTWDQGREMADHATLAATVGVAIYFADPHSPWQRPTNENGNGLLRRWLPKGTNLAIYSPADLQAIEHRLNTMPRRSLGWHTAHDLYTAATINLSR